MTEEQRMALNRESADTERVLVQLEADSNSHFGRGAPHYDMKDIELAIADVDAIAAAHIAAPHARKPDPISAPHLMPSSVIDISKLGWCPDTEGVPTTDELCAAPNLIVDLQLIFPAAGPHSYYGAQQINSDADIPPAPIMNLAFVNAREMDQLGLLQRYPDGQSDTKYGTECTYAWINSGLRATCRQRPPSCRSSSTPTGATSTIG